MYYVLYFSEKYLNNQVSDYAMNLLFKMKLVFSMYTFHDLVNNRLLGVDFKTESQKGTFSYIRKEKKRTLCKIM